MSNVLVQGWEMARVGSFPVERGDGNFTQARLEAMVEATATHRGGRVPLVLGHHRPAGSPAYGQVRNLRMLRDRMVGDLEVPAAVYDAMRVHYPDRSIEASSRDGQEFLSGVAMLGSDTPAVTGLADLPILPDVVVAAGDPTTILRLPLTPPKGSEDGAIPPNKEPSVTQPTLAAAARDALKAVGIVVEVPDDAAPEQVKTLLAAAFTPEPPAPVELDVPTLKAAAEKAGLTVVEKSVADLQAGQIKTLGDQVAALVAEKSEAERSSLLAAALADGRILPAEEKAWSDALAASPDHVKALLAAAPKRVAFGAVGVEPAPNKDEDAAVAALIALV
jgi:hypothetical protein